jgi:hypothetical protein
MSDALRGNPGRLKLRLPATSANLGPGFDAAAVALDFYLEIDAEPAAEFSIEVSGRNAADGWKTISSWRFTRACLRATDGRVCRWRSGWRTASRLGWAAAPRRPDGWRELRWRTTLASWVGAPSRSLKRLVRWRVIRTTRRLAGSEGLWWRPVRAGMCMPHALSPRRSGEPSLCFLLNLYLPAWRGRCCRKATGWPTWWRTFNRPLCWVSPLPKGGATCFDWR